MKATDPVRQHQRELDRAKRLRKKAEHPARRVALFTDWLDPLNTALAAQAKIDRLDRENPLLSILLLLLLWTPAYGQPYVVLADTNQVKLLPRDVKVDWRSDLFSAER